MPFGASHHHEYWTSDVRYVDHSIPGTGQAYVVAVLENYSRAILASAVTLSQDTHAYLSVLHAAGDPESARSGMERHPTLAGELFEERPERVFVAPRV